MLQLKELADVLLPDQIWFLNLLGIKGLPY